MGLAVIGGAGWGLIQAARGIARAVRHQSPVQRTVDFNAQQAAQRQFQQRQRQYQCLSRQAREMQLAILNLETESDPDFRRAAAAARTARQVPVDFRQRQFQRLRPLLVTHFVRCSNRGGESELLLESLTELVEALGMEAFEADYIRQESERRLEHRPGHAGHGSALEFQSRLQQLQQQHDQRVQVIRSLGNLAEEVREQLLEAEDRRFQQQLFGRDAV